MDDTCVHSDYTDGRVGVRRQEILVALMDDVLAMLVSISVRSRQTYLADSVYVELPFVPPWT